MAILNDLLRSFQSMIGIKQATKKNVVGKKATAPTKKSNGTLRKPTVRSRNANGNGHRNGNGSNGNGRRGSLTRTRVGGKLAGSKKSFRVESAANALASVSARPSAGKLAPVRVAEGVAAKVNGILVGEITHYFSKIKVVVVKITAQSLKTGDKILIQGKTQGFTQTVKSLQIENKSVPSVKKGQLVGLKVSQAARVGDKVYKI